MSKSSKISVIPFKLPFKLPLLPFKKRHPYSRLDDKVKEEEEEEDYRPGPVKKLLLKRFKLEHGLWRKPRPTITRSVSLKPNIPADMEHMFLDVKLIPESNEKLKNQQLEPIESCIILNIMMKAVNSNIRWYPSTLALQAKLKNEPNYAARTGDFTEEKLHQIIDLLREWIKNPFPAVALEKSANKIFVVDFMNLLYFEPIANIHPDAMKYKVIEFMLKKHMADNGYTRIIICVQNNELRKTEFNNLMRNLYKFLGDCPKSVLILPGHNRSSMDDLFVILCCELLKQEELIDKSGVFTGDMYADFITDEMFKIFIDTYYNEIQFQIADFKTKSDDEKDRILRELMVQKIAHLKSLGYQFTSNNVYASYIPPPIIGAPRSEPPSSGYPSSGYPSSGYPSSGYPSSGYPSSGYPSSGVPRSDDPRSDDPRSGYPSDVLSSSGYPIRGVPSHYVPRSGVPSHYVPRSGVLSRDDPRSGAPRSGAPRSGYPIHDDPRSDVPRSGVLSRDDPRSRYSSHGPPRSERSRSPRDTRSERSRSPRDTRSDIPRHGGGTIKYKKSLLNKRTRKIYTKNYSQKMKKYSKNKKKKTLRRIRL